MPPLTVKGLSRIAGVVHRWIAEDDQEVLRSEHAAWRCAHIKCDKTDRKWAVDR